MSISKNVALASIFGAVCAIVAVMMHRFLLNAIVPMGLIGSLLFIAAMGGLVRFYSGGRLFVLLYAVVAGLCVLWLASLGPQGSILLVGIALPGEQPIAAYAGRIIYLGTFPLALSPILIPQSAFRDFILGPRGGLGTKASPHNDPLVKSPYDGK